MLTEAHTNTGRNCNVSFLHSIWLVFALAKSLLPPPPVQKVHTNIWKTFALGLAAVCNSSALNFERSFSIVVTTWQHAVSSIALLGWMNSLRVSRRLTIFFFYLNRTGLRRSTKNHIHNRWPKTQRKQTTIKCLLCIRIISCAKKIVPICEYITFIPHSLTEILLLFWCQNFA